MKVKSGLIKKLRIERNWSQEELSAESGLSLRTIQRIESGGNPSMESLKILSETFGLTVDQMLEKETVGVKTPMEAVKTGFEQFSNFSGRATRYEYWWFLLFLLIVMSVATIIHEKVGMIVDVLFLVPLVAAGNRRLNDAGESPWWQLFLLAPFGFIVVFILMARPSKVTTEEKTL